MVIIVCLIRIMGEIINPKETNQQTQSIQWIHKGKKQQRKLSKLLNSILYHSLLISLFNSSKKYLTKLTPLKKLFTNNSRQ